MSRVRAYRATLLVSTNASPDDVLGAFVTGLDADVLTVDHTRFPGQVEVAVRYAAVSDAQALALAEAARRSTVQSGGLVRSADPVRVRRGRLAATERESLALGTARVVQIAGRKP